MSGGSSAPMAYTPSNQAGQDQNYNQLSSLLNTQGGNLINTAIPGYNSIYSAMQNNPYYGTAQQGAGQVATQGQGVAAGQAAGASQMTGLAGQAGQYASAAAPGLGYAQGAVNATSGAIPQGMSGGQLAPGVFNQAQSMIPATTQPELAAGGAILNTAFDPQSALYNQQYQQLMDQTNASNASNGLAGSPFAAGLNSQAGSNFNINWQNNQLNRETQGLSAYDSAASTAAGNLEGLQTAGTNNFNSLNNSSISNLLSLISGGASAFGSYNNTADQGYSTAVNGANTANTSASTLGDQSLQTLLSSSQAPDAAYSSNQNQILAALNALNTGTNTALQPAQQGITDAGSYLGIGQSATQINDAATQQNNQQQQAFWSGLSSLLGVGGQIGLGLATGGMSLPFTSAMSSSSGPGATGADMTQMFGLV